MARQSLQPQLEALEDRCVPTASHAPLPHPANRDVTVMTRNLYVGADFDPVVNAGSPSQAVTSASIAWAQTRATNFPERAKALADEIADNLPTLVGLQEVSWFRSGPAFDPAPATETVDDPATPFVGDYDYLKTLLNELALRGLHYQVVAENAVFDAELPIVPNLSQPTVFKDFRLTDRDVILARSDLKPAELKLANVQVGHYVSHLAGHIGGPSGPVVGFDRGWESVDVTVRGKTFRFVNTHLEPGEGTVRRAIQEKQALELLAGPANTDLPVIMVGDYNSEADPAGTEQQTDSYDFIRLAGFADLWNATHPSAAGNTHGHAANLLDADPTLETRIDFIFARGDVSGLSADIVGDELADRTASGLWPSDHAGLVGDLALHSRPSHEHTVPLFGVFSGQTQSAMPTADPNVIAVVTAGSGWATQLGPYTMVSPHFSILDSFVAYGTQTFTDAHGNTLTAWFAGKFEPIEGGLLRGVLRANITGGTGRFAGATGSYEFTIVFNPATLTSVAVFNGRIEI